jgi:beta-lactamase regulating signal transducer with metallopeptidase domain
MNQTVAVWMLIVVALFAANIPFLNDRLFALIPLRSRAVQTPELASSTQLIQEQSQRNDKSFFVRVLELLVLYVLVGLLAYFFESTIGNPFKQRWEFYSITFSLFVVLAFPGFVVRYLLRRS